MTSVKDYGRCPRCGRRTFLGVSGKFVHCSNIGCPWFLTTDDNRQHFAEPTVTTSEDDTDG
jgi:hypothetical protein